MKLNLKIHKNMDMSGLMLVSTHRDFDIFEDFFCETSYRFVVPKLLDVDPRAITSHAVRFRTLSAAKASISRFLNDTFLKCK